MKNGKKRYTFAAVAVDKQDSGVMILRYEDRVLILHSVSNVQFCMDER